MNELQIFDNPKFGKIRTVELNEKTHFVASDVAKALKYQNTSKAINDHCRWVTKCYIPHPQSKSASIEVNVIPEGDIYRLVAHSELPAAEEFESWIFDEVIPTIRKTGTYSIKPVPKGDAQLARARAMELNARTRAAQTWLKIAAAVDVPEYKQIASTYAANTLANKEVLSLPEVTMKTYTATEIGNMYGVSANKIGKLANAHGLKTAEYGIEVWDKSPYSAKQIPSWRYYENVIPIFEKLIHQEPKPLEVVKGGVK